jgi:hypothetical protein
MPAVQHDGQPLQVTRFSLARMGEHLVQYAAALLGQSHEPAVVTGNSTTVVPSWSASATALRLASWPFDVAPTATTMRVDAARCASISGRSAAVRIGSFCAPLALDDGSGQAV